MWCYSAQTTTLNYKYNYNNNYNNNSNYYYHHYYYCSSCYKANLGQFVEIGQGQAFQREQMQWARRAPSLPGSVRSGFVF